MRRSTRIYPIIRRHFFAALDRCATSGKRFGGLLWSSRSDSGIPHHMSFQSAYTLSTRRDGAANSYEAQPYPGRITLFRGTRSKAYWLHRDGPCLG